MRKSLIVLAVATAALAPLSHAGMFDAVKGAASLGGSSNSGGDLIGQQTRLVELYVAANKEVLMAQSKMALALGAKDAAALAKAEADALTSGATKDNLAKADSVQSKVAKAISEGQQAQGVTLDAQAKKTYAEGMGSLGLGLLKYAGMAKQFDGFKSALSSASPMDLPKLSSGSYIITSFPGNSKNLYNTLNQAISFAKSNDIPVPKDATKAL